MENSVYNELLLLEEEEEEEGVCLTSPIPPHQTTDDVRGSEVTASGRVHACLKLHPDGQFLLLYVSFSSCLLQWFKLTHAY